MEEGDEGDHTGQRLYLQSNVIHRIKKKKQFESSDSDWGRTEELCWFLMASAQDNGNTLTACSSTTLVHTEISKQQY